LIFSAENLYSVQAGSHITTIGIQEIVGPVSLSNTCSECKHKLHNTTHSEQHISTL